MSRIHDIASNIDRAVDDFLRLRPARLSGEILHIAIEDVVARIRHEVAGLWGEPSSTAPALPAKHSLKRPGRSRRAVTHIIVRSR